MKTIIRISSWRKTLLVVIGTLLFIINGPAAPIIAGEDGYLLKTHWYQDGPFALFTPNHDRVGCWSTAYAQILYYHRLQPRGRVTYDCSSGYNVDVDLDQYRFAWDKFPDEITPDTPPAKLEEVARYSFAIAATVHKDFGTDHYKRLLNSVQDLEAHFDVDAAIYLHLRTNLPISKEELARKMKAENIFNVIDRQQLVALLTTEIGAGRPVYFHFGNIKNFGHSTVIDGIRKEGNDYLVHINFGAREEEPTRWYALFGAISQPDDTALRAFVTIKPRRTVK